MARAVVFAIVTLALVGSAGAQARRAQGRAAVGLVLGLRAPALAHRERAARPGRRVLARALARDLRRPGRSLGPAELAPRCRSEVRCSASHPGSWRAAPRQGFVLRCERRRGSAALPPRARGTGRTARAPARVRGAGGDRRARRGAAPAKRAVARGRHGGSRPALEAARQAPSFAGLLDVQRLRLGRKAARLTLDGGPGLQGLWLRRLAEGRALVELELDHEANHPFRPLRACTRRRAPRQRAATSTSACGRRARRRRLSVLAAPRRQRRCPCSPAFRAAPGPRSPSSITPTSRTRRGSRRWPSARPGRSRPAGSARSTRAWSTAAWSTASRSSCGACTATRSSSRARSTARLLERLQQAGVELGLHSLSGAPDWRERRAQAAAPVPGALVGAHLGRPPALDQLRGALQPGLGSAQPLLPARPACSRPGVRHLWSGDDVAAPPGSLNLLEPELPGSRRPLIYPFGLGPGSGAEAPWLFASSAFFIDRGEVVEALREETLSRLEKEHGLFHRPRLSRHLPEARRAVRAVAACCSSATARAAIGCGPRSTRCSSAWPPIRPPAGSGSAASTRSSIT